MLIIFKKNLQKNLFLHVLAINMLKINKLKFQKKTNKLNFVHKIINKIINTRNTTHNIYIFLSRSVRFMICTPIILYNYISKPSQLILMRLNN